MTTDPTGQSWPVDREREEYLYVEQWEAAGPPAGMSDDKRTSNLVSNNDYYNHAYGSTTEYFHTS
jgi:hypothetical protein